MANRFIRVTLPKHLQPEQLAQNFAAYLLGHKAFEKHRPEMTAPFLQGENYWQLDGSNDFWLTVEGTEATISCRYDAEIPALEAMGALFKWRFERHLTPA